MANIKKDQIEWGWVVYGQPNGFDRWKKDWENTLWKYHIVNNKRNDTFGQTGSNQHAEFSGYLELIEQFQGDGPFVIANDTWFKTHYSPGWSKLLRVALQKLDGHVGLHGDIRWEPSEFQEKPSPYFSTWIFLFPHRTALNQFRDALIQTIENCHEWNLSKEYKEYVNHWLHPSTFWRGWHQKTTNPELIEMKKTSIYREHFLNNQLIKNGLITQSLGFFHPRLYFALRLMDRLRTRLVAWGFKG